MSNKNKDKQQLESFLESITRLPIMAHAIDEEGILLNVSDFWLKNLGYEREEVIGQRSITFLTEESQKHAEQTALPEYFAKGFIENVQYQLIRKDNTIIDVLLSANSHHDEEGAFLYSLATIVDITEKKHSEELLQESEVKYKNLVNNIPGTSYQFVMSADGRFRFDHLSDNCLDLFGHSGEEIKNDARLIFDNIPQPDADEVIQAIEKSASTLTPYCLNHRFIKKDGERIWIYASSIPRRLPDGPIIWDGIGLDITKQKQAENEKDIIRKILFEAEKLANVGGWEWDVVKDKWTMSENWLRIHGCTEKHLSTSELIIIGHPDDRQNIQDAFERAIERGTPYEIEHRIIRQDTGEERYIKAYGATKTDSAGKPLKIYGAAQDITKIKHITEELHKSRERFELAMEAARDGLYDWDLMSNEIFFSPAWKRMLGYRADELPNDFSVWEELTEPEDRRKSCKMQQELVSKKRDRFEMELKMKHKDGHWVDILSRATAIFADDGRAVRIIGTHVDITERKRLEANLLQAQKMEAIGTLAGGIAHDFNNILGAILGYAEMVQDNCPTGSMMRSDIDRVVEASLRAKELVKQILAFSRQAETEEGTLQPALILQEAIKMLRASLPTTIDIEQKFDPETGLTLADSTQIHQIITNLCTNAFHAMEETGGTLTITLKNKEFTLEDLVGEPHVQPGLFVEISVGDTGPGIAPEIKDRIFDPFFTTKDVGKGTGMGLAIIHGIAKKYSGFVSCTSSPGKGTTFHVYLPVYAVTAPTEAVTVPPELVHTGIEHILFIDDEEMLAEMGKTMLERLGYRVTVETNSVEALKTIQDQPHRFDLVITDQTMPGMTGSDLARRILQIRPELPIILSTGFSNQVSEEKARIYGIKGFAMKPLAKKDLATLIRKVLDGEKPGK